MTEKFWNDERCELCRALWSKGMSASAIAVEIGAPSRNSVLSKIHRSGWSGARSFRGPDGVNPEQAKRRAPQRRRTGHKFARKDAAPAAGDAPKLAPTLPEPSPMSATSFAPGGMKPLLQLNADECRWPIGDPRQPGFGFCAARRHNDRDPYCPAHNRVAYGG